MKKKIVLLSVENRHCLTWEKNRAFLEKLREAVMNVLRETDTNSRKEEKS